MPPSGTIVVCKGLKMRIFKNKEFHKWQIEVRLTDLTLKKAINEIESGLYEANLGGNVYKKRVPIENRGKSGGARTIIAFKLNNNAFFIYGFSKNERVNITHKENNALKELAKVYFSYDKKEIDRAVKSGELIEISS